jgi:ferritin-like metal-binding protein YciE
MPHKETSLQKLFEAQVQDIYYAEKQLVDALPKMQKAARDEDLAAAFADHLGETKQHVKRLERVFDLLDQKPKAEKCEAINGIIKEAEELMKDFKDEEALDAALIAGAQKAEHYEIATYGTLAAISDQLGLSEIGRELRATLKEEKKADEKLSGLSNACNPIAAI